MCRMKYGKTVINRLNGKIAPDIEVAMNRIKDIKEHNIINKF